MNKKKILISILIIIIAIFAVIAIFFTVKAFKLKSIIEKADTYKNLDNYYAKIEKSSSDGSSQVQEIFFYNGKLRWIFNNSDSEMRVDYNSNTGYTIDNTTEVVSLINPSEFPGDNANENTVTLLGPSIDAESIWDYYTLAMKTKIEENDTSYILRVGKYAIFTVDKDSGICTLEEHFDGDIVTSSIKNEVTFDTVTEEDVKMLDLTDNNA